jgi:uncharacterized damage-inducible protein DinB
MSDDFSTDLANARSAAQEAREALRTRIGALDDTDLDRERRGGWPVRRVLEHVVESEVAYARVIAHLRSATPRQIEPPAISSVASTLAALQATRAMLLDALDGVSETEFYELRALGHEQYSILSVLENVAMHDDEHLGQIGRILAT